MLIVVSEPGPPLLRRNTSGSTRSASATVSAPIAAISSAVTTLIAAGVVAGSWGRRPATSTSGSSNVGGLVEDGGDWAKTRGDGAQVSAAARTRITAQQARPRAPDETFIDVLRSRRHTRPGRAGAESNKNGPGAGTGTMAA